MREGEEGACLFEEFTMVHCLVEEEEFAHEGHVPLTPQRVHRVTRRGVFACIASAIPTLYLLELAPCYCTKVYATL